jgi:glycosyltransferase involved in cell wall biosynthesis
MAVADALVFPHSVGLSVSGPLMLAAAAGTPVVVSDVPVLANLVGCPAATFRRTDHADLARTIARVIEDQEVREDLGRRLSALAKSCSWEIVARQTLQAYQDVGRP